METSVVVLGSLGLLLFGIALGVSVLILSDPGPSKGGDVIRTMLKVAAMVIVPVALLAGPVLLILLHADEAIGPAVFSMFVGSPAMVVVGLLFWWQCWVARQHAFLWMLTTTAERKMPLAPSIEAFAEEQGGAYGRRLKQLAARLRAGITLPRALMQSPGLVPRASSMMIHMGYRSDALDIALRRVVDLRESRTPLWVQLATRAIYLFGIALFGLMILSFITLKISPAFSKIFDDFETELPQMTQFVLTATMAFGEYWYLWPPIFLVLGSLFLVALVLCVNGGMPLLPGVRLFSRMDTAAIFDALALTVSKGRPLLDGIDTMATTFPRMVVRSQLFWVGRDLRAGTEWTQSLVRRHLIQPADQAVLLAAQRIDNLPWVLREMAESNRRRMAYRFDLLLQVLFPIVLLIYGILVMFIVVGYFMPLISLIEKLTYAP